MFIIENVRFEQVADLNLSRLWAPSTVDEEFLNTFVTAVSAILEHPQHSKNENLKTNISMILSHVFKQSSASIQIVTCLLHCLYNCEVMQSIKSRGKINNWLIASPLITKFQNYRRICVILSLVRLFFFSTLPRSFQN